MPPSGQRPSRPPDNPSRSGSDHDANLTPRIGARPAPVLAKSLVITTDDAPDLDRDLEGLVVLSPTELLLVTDNDFSVEGARTRFWRIRLAAPLA